MVESQFKEGEKLFFTGTSPDLPCVVLSITTPAGGVSGEKNMMITVQIVSTGYVMTFPIYVEGLLLRRVKQAVPVQDTDIEETGGELAEDE